MLTKERLLDAIRPVKDPELGYSVVDLGLIYEVAASDQGDVTVQYTLTSPSCPFGDALVKDVRDALLTVHGVRNVSLNVTFDPPWGPERITDQLRRELRMMGMPV